MQRSLRGLAIAAASISLAACSANSAAPTQSSGLTPSVQRVPHGMRLLPGPMVAGPLLVSAVPLKPNAPAGWPDHKKKKKELLFVSDASSGVLIYDPTKANSSPTGSITTGVNAPAGLAVDSKGNLYVTETYEGKRVQKFVYAGPR